MASLTAVYLAGRSADLTQRCPQILIGQTERVYHKPNECLVAMASCFYSLNDHPATEMVAPNSPSPPLQVQALAPQWTSGATADHQDESRTLAAYSSCALCCCQEPGSGNIYYFIIASQHLDFHRLAPTCWRHKLDLSPSYWLDFYKRNAFDTICSIRYTRQFTFNCAAIDKTIYNAWCYLCGRSSYKKNAVNRPMSYICGINSNSIKPFIPKSDQFHISPAASPAILHHTVRRTWLFIAPSDERWLYYQFSLPPLYISLWKRVGRMYLLSLGVKPLSQLQK